MENTYIIGIAGGSGSGKTTFLNKLKSKIKDGNFCLISLDNYYRPKHEQPIDQNGIENYDTLESLNIEELIYDIQLLKKGETVRRKEYDFNNPHHKEKTLILEPAKIIIIEGLFVFAYPELNQLFDLKLFIETSEHLRITRRLERDLKERGYSVEETLYWMRNHVEPAYKKFVLPYKDHADLIIPNHHNFETAVSVLASFINSKV